MDNSPSNLVSVQALGRTLTLGFKFVAWLNGLGLLLTIMLSMGVTMEVSAVWYRLPLAAYLSGLALAGLGLLWSCPAQTSLLYQLSRSYKTRGHWVPLFCTLLAYALSMIVFVMGCWALQSLFEAVQSSMQ
ncbi:hypothetical protein H0A71_13045 [Alcaligenaceae bacterium]|nr:hypothetical protein [Alcaligenaceae bacterium]